MFNHEPPQYQCPFCLFISGGDDAYTVQEDVVFRDKHTTAAISSKWWPNNAGSIFVVPNKHVENIYNISEEDLGAVYATARKLAIAIRETYGCDGISTRQHNEPAGNQDVWHFHVHVFPRYTNDNLYKLHEEYRRADAAERAPYAQKLRAYFERQA